LANYEVVSIPLADLQLDPGNARLGEEQPSQQAIYIALAQEEGRRLIKLASDIVEHGLDPTTYPAVVPTGDLHTRYRVIEGNRRVLALKALETPSIVSSAFAPPDQRSLNELASRYARSPLATIKCVLFESEPDADHWIQLRHTGANDGVGLVEWDANEQDRWRARHGAGAARTPAGQVIDFVTKVYGPHPSANRGILTNVKRLISTPEVRESLGLDLIDGQVVSYYPAAEVSKGLRRVVNDLREKRIKVNDIYYESDRLDYIKSLSKEALPDPSTKLAAPVALGDLASGKIKPAPSARRKRPGRPKPTTVRTSVIPATCRANVTHPRISAIYNELLNLNTEQFPNACAVLLRVFLELSADHEIGRSSLMTEEERRNSPLSKRLKLVAEHLRDNGRIDDQLLKAIQKIADSQDVISASTVTFNQYVHNPYVYPKPSELRTAWDELQPFVEKLWP
jgi:hypothetical protein